MYAKTFALLAVSALSLSLSAQAAPAASGTGSATGSGTALKSATGSATALASGTETPVTLPIPTQLGFPTGTVTLSDAVNWVNVHSDSIAAYIGSSALQGVQATLGVMSAQKAIGTATHLTALIATDVNSAPVVVVSSIGGSAITLATGTVGSGVGTTTFGGQAFRTAAPAVLAAADNSSSASSSGAAASSTNSASGNSTMSSSASTSTGTGKNNGALAGVSVPRSAVVGALAVLGSVVMGAVAVL